MKYKIGVDVGGTKISVGLVEKGKVIRKVSFGTAKGKEKVLGQIVEGISLVLEGIDKKQIKGIGMGLPGIINKKKGRIIRLPNLRGFENFNIVRFLSKKFRLPVKIENDSTCAVIAEHNFGFCADNMVLLTLGTGIGGGVIINGELYSGGGNAPEPGHLIIENGGRECNCGSKGCLEEYFSGRAIIKEARKEGLRMDIIQLQKEAEKGNKKARRIYEEAGKNLGIGLSNIIKLLDPELIILSGGLSNAHNLFLHSAQNEMRKRTFFRFKGQIKIAKTLKDGGVIGATLI
ncbi:MAG: ROK family protein [Nanoarchaeota archaeon]|nr:ROK family protein [Nanoarchaeota archaeon]